MWIWLTVAIIGLVYLYLKNNYNYWKKRGLDTPKYYYLVGNFLEQITLKKNAADILQEAYKSFEGYNYFGYYNAMQPAIVVRNPEMIGEILVKDFASFGDNDFDVDEVADPIMGKNPFVLNGQRWKDVRGQATPSFTSGKIKMMMPLLKETSTKFLTFMKNYEEKPVDIDFLTKRINAENVASCAFGLNGGSFTAEKADFVEIANEPINPSWRNTLANMILFICPSLGRIFNISFYTQKTIKYLHDIIEQTMKYRRDNNIQRNDFLDEMKRLREKFNDDKSFSSFDILGHAGGFLIDGVITSSIVANYTLFRLADNQDIQDKLREEIQEFIDNPQQLTYEKIQEMEYLDCVLKESLRQHPPLMFMIKRVTKPYTMGPMREDNTGPRIELEVGTPVIIPLCALHMDEKYFPEPDKYDPERWKRENKDSIVRNSYLPFSDGPRVCLGMKFGLLQTKLTLITIITNYRLKVSEKTKRPLKIDPGNFFNMPVGGHWLELTKL